MVCRMSGIVSVTFLVGLCIFSAHSVKLPAYLKPCSLSDPNLNECCVNHGKEALPFLVKGDRKYNVPSLAPLFLPKLSMDATQDLHVIMTDIYTYGLEKADIKQIRFDVKNMKVTLKLKIDNLQLIGKYAMSGKILILPIEGKGDFNITAIGGEYQYDFEYVLKKKRNENYVVIKDNDILNFKLNDAVIKLDNLFNGDETLGKHMNMFLNENWRDVLNEIGGTLSETVRSVVKIIITGYSSKIPYDQLFLK